MKTSFDSQSADIFVYPTRQVALRLNTCRRRVDKQVKTPLK